jgi:hypothetical protein
MFPALPLFAFRISDFQIFRIFFTAQTPTPSICVHLRLKFRPKLRIPKEREIFLHLCDLQAMNAELRMKLVARKPGSAPASGAVFRALAENREQRSASVPMASSFSLRPLPRLPHLNLERSQPLEF